MLTKHWLNNTNLKAVECLQMKWSQKRVLWCRMYEILLCRWKNLRYFCLDLVLNWSLDCQVFRYTRSSRLKVFKVDFKSFHFVWTPYTRISQYAFHLIKYCIQLIDVSSQASNHQKDWAYKTENSKQCPNKKDK